LDREISLAELPVINKGMVMDSFDRLVTVPDLHLADVRDHLEHAVGDALFRGEYRGLSTSGTTGLKGVFLYGRREWSIVLADTLRWQHIIGVVPRFPKRLRIATIGAGNSAHVSYRLVASGDVGLFNFRILDATVKTEELVDALNDFQPDALLPYPSIGALLASEQIEGRLQISPRIISTHSESLSPGMAAIIERAWGRAPFDHYGLSEHPNCGCTCAERKGIHLFEDLFIAEIVDEKDRPVPPGEPGFKLLLTNLYNRTQPLIRYEVSDMLTISRAACPCGRPFRLASKIGGRSDDIVYMPGTNGVDVPVHPLHFYDAMETVAGVKQYQIVEKEDGVHVRVVPRAGVDPSILERALAERLVNSLKATGVSSPKLHFEFVEDIKPSPEIMGKTKLIVSRRKTRVR
jgi:phenylacetate-coenzyme A ligase PaaK-like adenylate-forming protein